MGKNTLKLIVNLLTVAALVFGSSSAFAQGGADDLMKESMTDLAVVAGVTLSGALLGLSTLSFADRPSEKTDNILIGGAFGLILGVGLVAMMQAGKSKDMYYEGSMDMKSFDTSQRYAWHATTHNKNSDTKLPNFSYSFSF